LFQNPMMLSAGTASYWTVTAIKTIYHVTCSQDSKINIFKYSNLQLLFQFSYLATLQTLVMLSIKYNKNYSFKNISLK